MSKIIKIENLSVAYEQNVVLNNVNLTINSDDFIGIIGPNGGGKTTLLKAILGLAPLKTGTIRFFDNDVEVPSLRIGYMPQNNNIDRSFPISVNEVVLSGLAGENGILTSYTREQKAAADEIIQQLDLESLRKRSINQLSGGQLQRTFLGRALVMKPQLLILDEPNSYLDKESENKLFDLLQELRPNAAIMLVSHNIASVRAIAKSLACVNGNLHYHTNTAIPTECFYEFY
ncbi:MAG: ATP-binding cassette domain-containing protein [Bacteroidales bacterium]|nr:ATP-binding cassette domain-containing protein [Bacteroidales bacterium]